jgi:hypothetical protein
VILNRGGRYPRYGLFEELEKTGFDYVLSMESSFTRYDLEALSQSFPFVRFILLKEPISPGEEINLAAAELSSPLFFVLWNDLKILRGGGAERMAERLLSNTYPDTRACSSGTQACSSGTQACSAGRGREGKPGNGNNYKRLCTVPLIQDARCETMPTLIAPLLIDEESRKRGMDENYRTIPFVPQREGLPSLFPFEGIGIYDRERFIRLNGFDPSIRNFYWQLMDFGFRSFLWGEKIACTQLIKLSYEGLIPEEDSTAGEGWRSFFLKNLAPVFRRDYAHIPLSRFPSYLFRRGSLFEAWKEFSAAREWVKTNRFRFISDSKTIGERFAALENYYASREGECRDACSPSASSQNNGAGEEL